MVLPITGRSRAGPVSMTIRLGGERQTGEESDRLSMPGLDAEDAQLRVDAARRREASRSSRGGEHAVARHDDRPGVLPEGAADRPRRGRIAEIPRDVPIGPRLARPEPPGHHIDGEVELR